MDWSSWVRILIHLGTSGRNLKKSLRSGLRNMKREKVERICEVCGKKFPVQPSRVKWGRGITCSPECQHILVGHKNSRPKIKLICKGCGKKFSKSPSTFKNKVGGGQFCSTKCAYANKKRGELSANWRGGKVVGNEKIRKSPEYKEWIKKVIKRDNYTCQVCGIKNVSFHIHHIKELAKYPELAMVVLNGLTVCVPCHSRIHNKHLRRMRND